MRDVKIRNQIHKHGILLCLPLPSTLEINREYDFMGKLDGELNIKDILKVRDQQVLINAFGL